MTVSSWKAMSAWQCGVLASSTSRPAISPSATNRTISGSSTTENSITTRNCVRGWKPAVTAIARIATPRPSFTCTKSTGATACNTCAACMRSRSGTGRTGSYSSRAIAWASSRCITALTGRVFCSLRRSRRSSRIRELLPGHTLEISAGGEPQISQYWDLRVKPDDDVRPRDYYVERYRELLEGCVASHLMSDVPLGVFLSGGLDSSAVAALTTKIRREPIETFAVGYGEESFSELPFARRVAQHIGSKHHEVRLSREEFFHSLPHLIWHEDEPIVWPSSVSLYFVARLARERVTVVLTGEGADETLAGYTRYAFTLRNQAADRIYRSMTPEFLRKQVRGLIGGSPLIGA